MPADYITITQSPATNEVLGKMPSLTASMKKLRLSNKLGSKEELATPQKEKNFRAKQSEDMILLDKLKIPKSGLSPSRKEIATSQSLMTIFDTQPHWNIKKAAHI
jgi:hypothetical protein